MREQPPAFYLLAPLVGALLWLAMAWLGGDAHDLSSAQSEFLRGLAVFGGMAAIMFIVARMNRNA